jgi:hypothetical protein
MRESPDVEANPRRPHQVGWDADYLMAARLIWKGMYFGCRSCVSPSATPHANLEARLHVYPLLRSEKKYVPGNVRRVPRGDRQGIDGQ